MTSKEKTPTESELKQEFTEALGKRLVGQEHIDAIAIYTIESMREQFIKQTREKYPEYGKFDIIVNIDIENNSVSVV